MSRPIRILLSPLQAEALNRLLGSIITNDMHIRGARTVVALALAESAKPEPPGFLAVAADPKPFRRARLAKVKRSKAEKRESRAAIRAKVFARAAEDQGYRRCEGPQFLAGATHRERCCNTAAELAHAFGRGKGRMPESERTCLALCRACHRDETNNRPSGAFWWEFFADFFHRRGYADEARAAWARGHLEKTRAALPAAPRVRP